MEKKKKTNWFKNIMLILFIIYAGLYILDKTGYYEGNARRKVEFTEEQIKKFEEDVKNGEKIDLNEYLVNQNKDYSNTASKLGYNISHSLETFLNRGLKSISDILEKLFS